MLILIQYDLCARSLHAFVPQQTQSLDRITDTSVTALHVTPDNEVLVGCEDGRVLVYDGRGGQQHSYTPSWNCSVQGHHGRIVGLRANVRNLLVVGFEGGQIHLGDATHGVRESMSSCLGVYCSSLGVGRLLTALECVPSETETDVADLWFGTDGNQVEVWSIAVKSDLIWSRGARISERVFAVACPALPPRDTRTKSLRLSHDRAHVMALLVGERIRYAIAFFLTRTKELVRVVDCGAHVGMYVYIICLQRALVDDHHTVFNLTIIIMASCIIKSGNYSVT